ncbi:hypothetical protein ACQ4LE_006388 [Meloidogyne hapla]|uniref:Secreted protein n=1 Tax=Meloidogyne hapla TaxID=6305 RepID=A0A1I8BX37_MELHA
MIFYLLVVFAVAVDVTGGQSCTNKPASLTFLTNTLQFKKTGLFNTDPGFFYYTKENNVICPNNNNLQTNCYNQDEDKISVGRVVCKEDICICNYDQESNITQACYYAKNNNNEPLPCLFYSFEGVMYVNPDPGVRLTRTDGKKHFEFKSDDNKHMNLTYHTESYINGKSLLVGCTICDNLKVNNKLRTCQKT